MSKIITAIIAGGGALCAWLLRGWLAGRKEEQLTRQRDQALINAEQNQINVRAAQAQSTILQAQQAREDSIHAANNKSVADQLDNIFK
jgi:hypothetical protein